MKKPFKLLLCLTFFIQNIYAQQKNYLKLNIGDCINCVGTLSKIIQLDHEITIVIPEKYKLDSTDVLEKFSLENHGKKILWSNILYDSLSKIFESELIQYCANIEINRSNLKNVNFYKSSSCNKDTTCLKGLPQDISTNDYKEYLIIKNNISNQHYVFFKKSKEFRTIKVDSNLVRSVYIDYLKDPMLYNLYMHMTTVASMFKPKIVSVCPLDDSTLLGNLITYKVDSITKEDTFFSKMISIVKINNSSDNSVEFVNNKLPLPFHYLNEDYILAHKKNIYISLLWDIDAVTNNNKEFKNLVRYKKQKQTYQFDKAMPTTLNEYLITNNVYNNCNKTYIDNGYSFMSLSNYILNLDTEEKIFLPFEDSVFKNIFLYPQMKGINYYVMGFKYNKIDNKFYIKYIHYNDVYVASFKANTKKFESKELLYSFTSEFCNALQCISLGWDGKNLLYRMKKENCFKYGSVLEIQELVRSYTKIQQPK